jgi:hypothetical protein
MLWTASKVGQRRPLCPDISEINLFGYCQGIIASIPDFGMPEQKLNGPLATAGIESFRIAREALKELEMSEGGRTIILIGLLRRSRPDQRANPRVPARRFALVDTSVRRW